MKYQNGQPLLGLVPAGVLDRHSQTNFQTSGYSTENNCRERCDLLDLIDGGRYGGWTRRAPLRRDDHGGPDFGALQGGRILVPGFGRGRSARQEQRGDSAGRA